MNIFGREITISKGHERERSGMLTSVNIVNEFEEALKKWDWARNTLVNTLGCAEPPIDPFILAALANCNGYHSNALYLKSSATVGQGYSCSDALRREIEYVNEDQTFEDFAEELQLDLETYGSMYVEVKRNARTAALYRSPALLTRVRPKKDGDVEFLQYEYKRGLMLDATTFEAYKRNMVSGIRQLKLAAQAGDRWYGTPEYSSIRKHLTLNLSITTLAEKWFENAMQIDKLFVMKNGSLTPAQTNMLRSFMSKTLKGVDNSNKGILLELARGAELQVQDLGGNIKEASFTELRKDNVHEIGAGHRVPSKLLGSPSSGQLGASNEIDGMIRLFKMTFVDGRQRKMQAFYRRLFRDAGLPDADTFTLNPMDTTAGQVDAQTHMALTGGQPILTVEEDRADWFGEKSAKLTPQKAAAVLEFMQTIDTMRAKL